MSKARSYDILIIGGGIAGTTAAETYRAGGGGGSVAIVSTERHPLYSRVLLPHAAKDKVPLGRTYLKDQGFYDAQSIDYLSGSTVVRIDPERREAELDDGSRLGYGKLVAAAGGRPRVWNAPGSELSGVMRLQTHEDARDIGARAKLDGDMVIVGAGFIALEFASIAIHYGMRATLLHRGKSFCASLMGPDAALAVRRALEAHGVEVRGGETVRAVEGEEEAEAVLTNSGERIPCALVGVGIGLELNVEPFAALGTGHGILTDDRLRTRWEGTWAAGDCAEFEDAVLGLRHAVGNWTNAAAQGRHVGRALLGEDKPFETLTSYTSNCVPGLGLVFIGETRHAATDRRVLRVLEEGRRVAEFHLMDGRMIGAVLVNAPELRKDAEALIRARTGLGRRADDLADPTCPLAALMDVA